jgi:hypothetical protein
MPSRQKVQADFDLERFIDMFDEALTSEDERVINALRSLMMMVILTKPETRHEGHDMNHGPLRQLFEDMHNLNRRMHSMEESLRSLEYNARKEYEAQKVYSARDMWPSIDKVAMDADAYKSMLKGVTTLSKLTKP